MHELSLREIVRATDGVLKNGSPELTINEISTDSRRIVPGSLFIALRGERFDGHDFIGKAVEAGATALLVGREVRIAPEVATIQVTDTLEALGNIAAYYRRQFPIPVIGITGSNGKTTTKDLVATVLAQREPIIKTDGNFNNEIGLPLTLFKISDSTRAAVVEMGMRGLGQIRRLAAIAKPTVGIVTNVGLSHLELLGSQGNIAKAKAELIEALPENGLAILNGDDPLVRAMKETTLARSRLYGIETAGLDYRATDIRIKNNGSSFRVYTKNEVLELSLPVPGRHNILNALAAIAVAKEMGVDNEAIKKGLEKPELTGKRLRITRSGDVWVIDDTYNASPTSVKAALDVLADSDAGERKIAVLADMLELGPSSGAIHRELGEYAGKCGIDFLMAFGPLAKEYVVGFNRIVPGHGEHFDDKSTLIDTLKNRICPEDLILVKGSRGMKMEEVVAALIEEEAK